MNRQKLYDADGNYTGKFIDRLKLTRMDANYNNSIIKANKQGLYIKEQLKDLRKLKEGK